MPHPKRRLVLRLAVPVVLAFVLAGCGSSGKSASTSSATPTHATPTVASTSAGSTSTPSASPNYGYYLSVGDSLAFGFQAAKFEQELKARTYAPASFNTGYSDLVLKALQAQTPGLVGTNLGCPGETTVTYLQGGCVTTKAGEALHVSYAGAQDAAAVAFLRKHSGPGLITVALGANDLNNTLTSCPDLSVACIEPKLPAVFSQVQTNLTKIVGHLHAAAPAAKIVVLQLYNPYAVSVAASDLVAQALNEQIADAARASGASLADAYTVFNPGGASEKTTLCRLTAYCTALKDIHPTDAGYAELATLFLTAAKVPAS
jgi:lysophospholipase L1-like esterase